MVTMKTIEMEKLFNMLGSAKEFDAVNVKKTFNAVNGIPDALLEMCWKKIGRGILTCSEDCADMLGIETETGQEGSAPGMFFTDLLIEILDKHRKEFNAMQDEGNADGIYYAISNITKDVLKAVMPDACIQESQDTANAPVQDVGNGQEAQEPVQPVQEPEPARETAQDYFNTKFGANEAMSLKWIVRDLIKKGASAKKGCTKEAINFVSLHMARSSACELLFGKWLRDMKPDKEQETAIEMVLNYLYKQGVILSYYTDRGGQKTLSGFVLRPEVMLMHYGKGGNGIKYRDTASGAVYILYNTGIYAVNEKRMYSAELVSKLYRMHFTGFAAPLRNAQ